ncbi:MAG: glutamate ligase domain-containing protein, partial [bacterium]
GVAREKMHLLDYLSATGLAVLHADDPWSRWIELRHRGRKATFGRSPEATWRPSDEWATGEGVGFELAGSGVRFEVPLHGRHQVANCLAAVAVAVEMGLDARTAAERLRGLVPPRWRMTVRRVRGMTFILDCYNANPASVACALDDLTHRDAGRRVAVLGDMLELGHVSESAHCGVGRLAAERGLDLVVAVGHHAALVAEAAREAGMGDDQVFWTRHRHAAARWLSQRLAGGDAVLFKGSRGMRVEEVAEAVEDRALAEEPTPAMTH